jgi:hypothetical protein
VDDGRMAGIAGGAVIELTTEIDDLHLGLRCCAMVKLRSAPA